MNETSTPLPDARPQSPGGARSGSASQLPLLFGSDGEAGGSGDSPLTSVMGSLLSEGIQEALQSASSQRGSAASEDLQKLLQDSLGRDARPEQIQSLAKEITSRTMITLAREAEQVSKGGASASPAKIAAGMEKLARKLQPDLDEADPKSKSTNPMVRMMQHAKQEMSDLKKTLDERALEFAAAKSRVQAAGSALGSRLMVDEKIAAIKAQGVTGDKSELNSLTNKAVAMAEPKDVRQKLKTAKEYKQYCEDAMWEVLTSGNVRDDKQAVPLPTFPATIDQNDRKAILTHLVDWSQIPSVVKRYRLLVPEVRPMAKVMDPITGIYQEPRKTIHADINDMYETQKRDLGLQIKSTMTSVPEWSTRRCGREV